MCQHVLLIITYIMLWMWQCESSVVPEAEINNFVPVWSVLHSEPCLFVRVGSVKDAGFESGILVVSGVQVSFSLSFVRTKIVIEKLVVSGNCRNKAIWSEKRGRYTSENNCSFLKSFLPELTIFVSIY